LVPVAARDDDRLHCEEGGREKEDARGRTSKAKQIVPRSKVVTRMWNDTAVVDVDVEDSEREVAEDVGA